MIDPIEALQGIAVAMGCFLIMGAVHAYSLQKAVEARNIAFDIVAKERNNYRDLAEHWKKQADLWERAYKFGRTIKAEPTPSVSLSQAEIRQLISLCHPDRHGGKQAAVQMTQRLLQMRGN